VWGSDIYKLDIGMPKHSLTLFESVFEGGVLVRAGLVATLIAGLLVVGLAIFFQKTASGRALRAWQTITRPLNRFAFRSTTFGSSCGRWRLVALVAGIVWGSARRAVFAVLVALKALPVLVLGDSIPSWRHRGRACMAGESFPSLPRTVVRRGIESAKNRTAAPSVPQGQRKLHRAWIHTIPAPATRPHRPHDDQMLVERNATIERPGDRLPPHAAPRRCGSSERKSPGPRPAGGDQRRDQVPPGTTRRLEHRLEQRQRMFGHAISSL